MALLATDAHVCLHEESRAPGQSFDCEQNGSVRTLQQPARSSLALSLAVRLSVVLGILVILALNAKPDMQNSATHSKFMVNMQPGARHQIQPASRTQLTVGPNVVPTGKLGFARLHHPVATKAAAAHFPDGSGPAGGPDDQPAPLIGSRKVTTSAGDGGIAGNAARAPPTMMLAGIAGFVGAGLVGVAGLLRVIFKKKFEGPGPTRLIDRRATLPRSEAVAVYNRFAITGHVGGQDASKATGYGGPAVRALLSLANFSDAKTVLDYGCGQGKLAELVLDSSPHLEWRGVDQSPLMVDKARGRLVKFGSACTIEHLEDGSPSSVQVAPQSVDRFVSTYCLDLMCEEDMFGVLDLAQLCLRDDGMLLLAGITWGYRGQPWSLKTFFTTCIWELLYYFSPKTVGGCRPQCLEPYLLERGWTIVNTLRTLPDGFPWMVSEVIVAKPPK